MISFKWTNGYDEAFKDFYLKTEEYYSSLVGGIDNRRSFVKYNISDAISHVIIAYDDEKPIACAGLKRYSKSDAEIKRVWVEPDYRGRHLAGDMMKLIEEKALTLGFKRTVLQTRKIMEDAVHLYEKLGYKKIDNYPPYDKLDGAICFAKDL